MKASELRIGNLVIFDNRIFEIDTIAKEFPTLNTIEFGIGVVDWNNINPIPLTEEWLLKFGFEKTEYCEGWFLNGILYYDGLMSENQKYSIQHVHQLQNLYFALTNEELSLTTTT